MKSRDELAEGEQKIEAFLLSLVLCSTLTLFASLSNLR
jgi:hypothetical protein